jgi:hypothetical protein
MEELLFSQKQYQALISRLTEISDDVTSIKLMSGPGTGYLDTADLIQLFQVTNRSIQRWRKSGRLPYIRIGRKYYYKADTLLESFKQQAGFKAEEAETFPEIPDLDKIIRQVDCSNCPLFKTLME